MQKGKVLKKAVIVILIFTLLATLLTSVAFAAGDRDYSKPGSVLKAQLNSADVLSLILPTVGLDGLLTDAEREYLELYGEFEITHGANIPSSYVTVGEITPLGVFTVKAMPYSYVAENGATVTFIPESAYIDNRSFEFSNSGNGSYTVEISSSYYDPEGRVRVIYSSEIDISASDANALINRAYYDSIQWESFIAEKALEYTQAMERYLRDKELYDAYVAAFAEYEIALRAYEAYLSQKTAYERKLAEYKQYLAELELYERELDVYEQYLVSLAKYEEDVKAYEEYLYVKENYDTLLQKYNKYVMDIETVRYQISILDGIKNNSTSQDRSIYNAVVIGTTVTEVVANKDAIANEAVGISPEIVLLAGDSTENIRTLFNAYFKLETEAEKYAFYIVNYEKLRNNLTSLFISLDKMYQNAKVRVVLGEKGIQEKYEILLAQLYYTVNALNDGPVYNYDKTATYSSSYSVNPITGAKPLAILENVPYISDSENAAPLQSGYPAEVKKPVLEAQEPSKPALPSFVAKPAEPYRVADPGVAPTEILKPSELAEVSDPGQQPLPYVPDAVIVALIEAVKAGSITRRDAQISESVKIVHKVELFKSMGNAGHVTVEFLNPDGTPICDPIEIEEGTFADFPGQTPVKESDSEADYVFAYWVDSNGSRYDLGIVNSDITLYPYFEKLVKSYNVVWKSGNEILSEQVLNYGEMPTAPTDPTKAGDGRYVYVFDGWDKTVETVSANVIYNAVFRQIPIFTAQGGNVASVQKVENTYIVDCGNSVAFDFNLSVLFTLIGENDFITVKSSGCSVTLSPETIKQLIDRGADGISVNTVADGSGYEISVLLLYSGAQKGAGASPVALNSEDIKISVSRPFVFADSDAVRLYYVEGGTRKLVKSYYADGMLTATYIANKVYYVCEEYSLNTLPVGSAEIKIPSVAKRGEIINVEVLNLPSGAVLDSLYYLDVLGNKTVIRDGSFVMPAHNVIIGAEYIIPVYTVTFVADGKVILSVEYKWGDTVTVPAVPDKAPDYQYYYTDGIWTPSVTNVTGNATYTAKYISHEIIREETDGVQITESLQDTLVRVGLIVFYVVAALAIVFIVVIKFVVLSRRRA